MASIQLRPSFLKLLWNGGSQTGVAPVVLVPLQSLVAFIRFSDRIGSAFQEEGRVGTTRSLKQFFREFLQKRERFPDLQTTIAQRTSIKTFSSYVGKIHLNGAVADNATNRLKLCWSGYLLSPYFVAQGLRPGFNYSQNQNKLKKYSEKGASLPTAISLREFTRGTMEF